MNQWVENAGAPREDESGTGTANLQPAEPDPAAMPPAGALPDGEVGEERSRKELLFPVLAGTVLLLAVLLAWLQPRAIGDLFISLAGGRDIWEGRLGAPDQWSCITAGRIWLNQNWGAHALIFLLYRETGQTGLLAFKMLMILLTLLFCWRATRRQGIRSGTAALVLGAALLFSVSFIDLRPNLFSITFTALWFWLMTRAADSPRRAWWLVPLLVAWSNLHGGFIIGFILTGVWLAYQLAAFWQQHRPDGWRRAAHLAGAAGGAVALSAWLNPFGVDNLLHPLEMIREPFWRSIVEWTPSWEQDGFGSTWGFFLVVGGLGVLAVLQLTGRASPPGDPEDPASGTETGNVNWWAALTLILLALFSRRLIPVALIGSVPVLAACLDQRRRLRTLLSLIFLIYAGSGLFRLYDYYRQQPDGQPLLTGMHMIPLAFPPELVRFCQTNRLAGPVINDWTWEGFLRWYCPDLKVFAGGRAQQMYKASECILLQDALNGRDLALLERADIPLAAVTATRPGFIALALSSGAWSVIYNDNRSVILANRRSHYGTGLIHKALTGCIIYPSLDIARQSITSCRSSLMLKNDAGTKMPQPDQKH